MQTILITGGTGKFGRVLVKALLINGYRVVFTSTSEDRIKTLCSEMDGFGSNISGIKSDLLDPDGVRRLLETINKRSISIDHLINNARSMSTLAVGKDGITKRDDFLSEFELDVVVPYELSMELARREPKTLRSIINVGSQYGIVVPNPQLYGGTLKEFPIQYGVSKAAFIQLTKELAVRLASTGIRANCVAYGGVEGRVDAEFMEGYSKLSPSRRMLSESDIAGPILFLLNESSSAVTGHTLVTDGGWTLW